MSDYLTLDCDVFPELKLLKRRCALIFYRDIMYLEDIGFLGHMFTIRNDFFFS